MIKRNNFTNLVNIKIVQKKKKGKNMQNSRLKNSIVLRGMASNIVDEAIVILKPNVKIKNKEVLGCKIKNKKSEKGLIVHEAEQIILEYLTKIKENELLNKRKKLESRNKILKISNIIFIIAFILACFS